MKGTLIQVVRIRLAGDEDEIHLFEDHAAAENFAFNWLKDAVEWRGLDVPETLENMVDLCVEHEIAYCEFLQLPVE